MSDEYKIPANTPRIISSRFSPENTIITVNGDLFEDGKARYVIPGTVGKRLITELTYALEQQEKAEAMLKDRIEAINSLLMSKGE